VVHGIVRNHGGEIWLASVPGQTRFDILLPTIQDLCLLPGDCAEVAPTGSEHLAFVEDDEDQLQVIPRVLSQLGYTVHPFHSGADAIRAICSEGLPVDLVITDYDMPEANGFDVARELAGCRPELPVIMVSGRKKAAELSLPVQNIKLFLGKPYNKDMIGRAVRDVLDKDA
jgi:DNA-binding NtrC family response regulator